MIKDIEFDILVIKASIYYFFYGFLLIKFNYFLFIIFYKLLFLDVKYNYF